MATYHTDPSEGNDSHNIYTIALLETSQHLYFTAAIAPLTTNTSGNENEYMRDRLVISNAGVESIVSGAYIQ